MTCHLIEACEHMKVTIVGNYRNVFTTRRKERSSGLYGFWKRKVPTRLRATCRLGSCGACRHRSGFEILHGDLGSISCFAEPHLMSPRFFFACLTIVRWSKVYNGSMLVCIGLIRPWQIVSFELFAKFPCRSR